MGPGWRGACHYLPLSAMIYSGEQLAETQDGAEALGTAIGGGLLTGLTGFVGFFLAAIFLVIALLVGREKQIVIVKEVQDQV